MERSLNKALRPSSFCSTRNFKKRVICSEREGAIQNRFELADQIDLTIGRHSLFFGGELIKTACAFKLHP
jgi:hypothetical protein